MMTSTRATRTTSPFRRVAAVATVLVAALAVAACSDSSDDDSNSKPDDNAGSKTTNEADAPAAPATIDFPAGVTFPEGMGATEDGATVYAGSLADGSVTRIDVESGEAEEFLPGGDATRKTTTGMRPHEDHLFVLGGAGGSAWVHDTESGDLVATLTSGEKTSFLNDVDTTSDGTAYVTDSIVPKLFRTTGEGANLQLEEFVDFTGTPFEYDTKPNSYNADGIQVTEDDRYAIVNSLVSGQLFRVDLESKEVVEIDVTGGTLTGPDGMELDGRTLYVAQNAKGTIATVELSEDFANAEITGEVTDEGFAFPTAVLVHGDDLLVLNAQLDKLGGGSPDTPFTISSVAKP